jgi:hypothetical protein
MIMFVVGAISESLYNDLEKQQSKPAPHRRVKLIFDTEDEVKK